MNKRMILTILFGASLVMTCAQASDPVAGVTPHPDGFVPPSMDDIPDGAFGDSVRRGKLIFDQTRQSDARRFVGNQQSCNNCHLGSGRVAGSAPMWAAWVAYPAYREKNHHVNTMEERLRGCFTYSMNAQASEAGEAPPPGHEVLKDLQSYMFWMAKGAPTGDARMPGRGYPQLDDPPQPYDPGRGAIVYAQSCAICHQAEGAGMTVEGQVLFPPLWGDGAYNAGAGMHRVNTAAAFIHANMPLGLGGTLSVQEAWDVAAYINSKPRPKDPRDKAGSSTSAVAQ